ncbi:MAG: CRISPR-associated endonuclease Cas2 [Pyrinomonadaceae bacterium]
MLFVVAYDIPDDGTRTLIADELQNWGRRVQYSVFECDLNDKRARRLEKKLAGLMSGGDNIRMYRVCQVCRERSVTMGGKPFAVDPEYYQV